MKCQCFLISCSFYVFLSICARLIRTYWAIFHGVFSLWWITLDYMKMIWKWIEMSLIPLPMEDKISNWILFSKFLVLILSRPHFRARNNAGGSLLCLQNWGNVNIELHFSLTYDLCNFWMILNKVHFIIMYVHIVLMILKYVKFWYLWSFF